MNFEKEDCESLIQDIISLVFINIVEDATVK